MAVGSGLASSIGIAAESTYGTYVAPTRWHEFSKEGLTKTKNTIQGGGLAAGRLQQLAARRVLATVAGEGPVDMEVTNTKMGLLLSHLAGSSTIAQQGATAAWLQTHTAADNVGKFLTVQKGVPDTTGTVRPYSFLGGKVAAAEFSCGAVNHLTSSWDFDFRDVTEAQGLAAPSYTTNTPFHGGQMAVKIGTFGAEASIGGITKVTLKIERPQQTDRFYAQTAGSPGLKAEPLINDYLKVTGTFEQDYVDKTTLADRFASDASTSLVWEFVGPLIASTFFQTFRIRVPAIFIDTETPTVEGPDVVNAKYSFVGQFDATNAPFIIEYMSTDTTI